MQDILTSRLNSDGKTVRIGNAIFPVAAPKAPPKPKPQRFIHVSAPLAEVKNEDGTVSVRVLRGTTYNVGRNASKRIDRRADVQKRVLERQRRP